MGDSDDKNKYPCFIRLKLSKQKEFVDPISLQVYKDEKAILTTNVDLAKLIKNENQQEHALPELKLKGDKKDKHQEYIPSSEDLIPLYHKEKLSEIDRTRENNHAFKLTMSNFPFDQEDSNALVGGEILIHIYRPDYDKKGNLIKEDDNGSSYNRPDIDGEYDEELLEKDLPFYTSPLQLAGETDESEDSGLIRYMLKLIRETNLI